MRPDLDDYEDLNEGENTRSRAMSWLVLVVAVGGFAALAYYAYHSGSQSVADGQVVVVEADPNPIKAAPLDAGGEEFPNKDKTIYHALDNDGNGTVEKLLPEAEEPVIPEPAVEAEAPKAEPSKVAGNATSTYVNKSLAETEAPVDPVDAQMAKQPAPAAAPAPEVKPTPAPVKVAEAPKPTPTPVATPKAEEKPVGTPEFVNVKPVAPAPAPVKKEEPKPVAKPAPKPAATPVASGNYKIQLGAFKSDSIARDEWSKAVAKNRDVLTGTPIVIKADVNGTTYYRLRATGFPTPEAAKAACAKVASRGGACMFAGK